MVLLKITFILQRNKRQYQISVKKKRKLNMKLPFSNNIFFLSIRNHC